MSSFLCFICHSTVNADTNEEMREKYREVVGMNLCPDSHLCHICCHVMNRLWLFRSVCLKRSLEYPVLFSEKGTLNLQRNDLEIHTVCTDDCEIYKSRNINSKYYHFTHFNEIDNTEKYTSRNEYVELEDERQDFDELLNNAKYENNLHENQFDNCFQRNKSLKEVSTQYNNEIETGNCYYDSVVDENRSNEINDNDLTINCNDNECFENENIFNEKDTHLDVNREVDSNITNEQDLITQDINDMDKNNDDDVDNEEMASADENNEKDIENYEYTSPNIDLNTETFENLNGKRKKKKSNRRKRFEKIILSVEEQKTKLEAKRRQEKYIQAEFKCYSCSLGFLFKDTYQAHMMRHEESNGEFQCVICGLRFATQAVLRSHTALHAERHRCLQCNTIIRRRQRKDHSTICYQVEIETASCHLCGQTFKDCTALQQHVRRRHGAGGGGGGACPTCGVRGLRPPALRTHMLKHIQRKFPCNVCGRTYKSPYTLRAHASTHERRAVCTCACGAIFSSGKALQAHRTRAKAHAATSFECPMCSRSCPSQRSLEAHVSTVHGTEAPHACPACPKRYATRKALTRHLAVHKPSVPSPVALCHLCGGSFKGNSKLNRHLREVCEKDKLEEELSSYYAQETANCGLNTV